MDELLNKEPVKRAQDALQRFDKSLKVKVLEKTARTANDASLALGCEVGAIVKSLLFRAENSFILCLVSGDKKCSLNKLKKITQKNDLCMASPDQVKTQTGYTIGGVSPVGLLNDIEIFMDNSLERFNKLYAAAGHPNCIFEINFKNAVWFGIILVSAGISYGMVSQKLEALESKQLLLEKAIMQDIPEIKERVIRLEILLEQALVE